MSIQGSSHIPQQPNWPSSNGQPLTNGGNPQLAKKILEGNSTSNSSIDIKKVSKTDSHKKTDNPDTYFSSRLPYFPPNSKPLQNIIEKVTSSRKYYLAEIEKTPQDMSPRTQFTIHTLALARICHQTKQLEDEDKLINSVQSAVDSFLTCKYFQAGTHLAKYLLDGYHGITCLDMNVIRNNLLTLRRAIALSTNNDTEHQKLIADLDKAAEFFEARWKELKDEGKLSEELYKLLGQQLKQTLTEDPFKDEFINNPELFKKVKDAPSILLQKYPHLASVNDFLSRYPDAGTIRLRNGTYNLQNLKLTLADAEASPLTQNINLLVDEPVITSTAAKLIRDFMLKHPKVKVYLSDEADGAELARSFLEDSTLMPNKGALVFAKGIITERSESVYSYMIDPQDPFVKKKPESWLSPSYINTTLSVDENLIPKTILENNSPSSSPSSTKKVSKTDSHKKADNPNTFFLPKLPYFPQNTKPSEHIITKVTTSRKRCSEEIDKNPQDMAPRTLFSLHTLALAKICHQAKKVEKEDELLGSVKTAVDSFLLCKYFHAGTHFSKYLLDGYQGITCLDMNVIRDNLLPLRRAIALSTVGDIDPQKLIADLDQAAEFFEIRWKELKDEGKLSEEDFKILGQQLKQILTEDPFKDEFINNPELFKKVKDAPPILLQKYPHLASVNDFLSKYPRAGTISLKEGAFTTENLKLAIENAKKNPLARRVFLINEDPLITYFAARMIKDFLVDHPSIHIYFGNEEDGKTLARVFKDDSTLIQGILNCGIGTIEGYDGKVFSYFVDPNNIFKRK